MVAFVEELWNPAYKNDPQSASDDYYFKVEVRYEEGQLRRVISVWVIIRVGPKSKKRMKQNDSFMLYNYLIRTFQL